MGVDETRGIDASPPYPPRPPLVPGPTPFPEVGGPIGGAKLGGAPYACCCCCCCCPLGPPPLGGAPRAPLPLPDQVRGGPAGGPAMDGWGEHRKVEARANGKLGCGVVANLARSGVHPENFVGRTCTTVLHTGFQHAPSSSGHGNTLFQPCRMFSQQHTADALVGKAQHTRTPTPKSPWRTRSDSKAAAAARSPATSRTLQEAHHSMPVDYSAAIQPKRLRRSAGLHRRNSEVQHSATPSQNLEAPTRSLEGAKRPFGLAGACWLGRWPKKG